MHVVACTSGGCISDRHCPHCWSRIPVRCSHCLCRASRDLQPYSSRLCMRMGVGNRVRGEEVFCWIRNGWNLISPTNSRSKCPALGLQWSLAILPSLPGAMICGMAFLLRHWALMRAALFRHRFPLALPAHGSRDSPLLSLIQNPFACLPTWWEMTRDVC